MLCFKGRSWCSASESCATQVCDRKVTDEVRAEATAWWRDFSTKPDDGPVFSYMDFSGRCGEYQPIEAP